MDGGPSTRTAGDNPDHPLKTGGGSATPNDLEFGSPHWARFTTGALVWTDLGGGVENDPEWH